MVLFYKLTPGTVLSVSFLNIIEYIPGNEEKADKENRPRCQLCISSRMDLFKRCKTWIFAAMIPVFRSENPKMVLNQKICN